MDVPSETDSEDHEETKASQTDSESQEEPEAKISKKEIICRGCGKEFERLINHITRTKNVKCNTAYSAAEIEIMREVNKKNSVLKKNATYNTKNRSQRNYKQKKYDQKNRDKKQDYRNKNRQKINEN